MGKIRLKCQIADLKTEVTCSVIENKTSNSLFLGRPWIHANGIVPSTLHQSFKYSNVDKNGQVQRLFSERMGLKPIARTQRCTYASDPEDEENEAEAHLEETSK